MLVQITGDIAYTTPPITDNRTLIPTRFALR